MKAREQGAGPREAAFASRDITLDFARMGPWSRQANAIIAFFNANIQAMDKMAREFKANPVKMAGRVTALVTIPSILLTLHNRQDPRWKDIPDWQKNAFWIIPTEKHLYRIPKPFDLGILFGSIPERIVEWIADREPTTGEAIKQALGNLDPDYMPTALNPWVEVYANRSRFTKRPIVPESKKDLPAALQSGKYTSRSMRELGKTLGYSPAKLEHLWRGYTGGLGQYGLDVGDVVLEKMAPENEPVEPAEAWSDKPIGRAFVVREPEASSKRVDDFYKMAEESERLYAARKQLKLGEDKRKIYRAHRIIAIYKRRLSIYRKRAERIEQSKSLIADQKREQLDAIYRQMAEIAGKANEALRSNDAD